MTVPFKTGEIPQTKRNEIAPCVTTFDINYITIKLNFYLYYFQDSVQLNWRQCCESALKNYYTFSDKLKSLEGIVHTALTIENIHQKESDIDVSN